jgi:S-adenosylmethionine:tRNA ribosyltransferase-isomerase
MKAATLPLHRPDDAKLLVIDSAGRLHHAARTALADFLKPGDLLVANDAATLPASLTGLPSAQRPASRGATRGTPLARRGPTCARFTAIVFGAGGPHARAPRIDAAAARAAARRHVGARTRCTRG